MLTFLWKNYRSSVSTTCQRGIKQAIYMDFNNAVLNCLLLAYRYFRVNELHRQRAMRLATLVSETTVQGLVALVLVRNKRNDYNNERLIVHHTPVLRRGNTRTYTCLRSRMTPRSAWNLELRREPFSGRFDAASLLTALFAEV